jgi:hypothetical protein
LQPTKPSARSNAKSLADPIPTAKFWNKAAKAGVPLLEKRKKLRLGIPRVLNIYTYAASSMGTWRYKKWRPVDCDSRAHAAPAGKSI